MQTVGVCDWEPGLRHVCRPSQAVALVSPTIHLVAAMLQHSPMYALTADSKRSRSTEKITTRPLPESKHNLIGHLVETQDSTVQAHPQNRRWSLLHPWRFWKDS